MARTQNHKDCDLPDVICKLLHSPVGKGTVTATHMYLTWAVNFRVPTVQDHFRWMCLREPRRLRIMCCLLMLCYPFVGSDMSGTCGFCYLTHWASFQLVRGVDQAFKPRLQTATWAPAPVTYYHPEFAQERRSGDFCHLKWYFWVLLSFLSACAVRHCARGSCVSFSSPMWTDGMIVLALFWVNFRQVFSLALGH